VSGTGKYRVTGPDAYAFLDHLSCNKLPAKDGRISLTLFHGEKGGIMAEQTVSRISKDHFVLMGAIGSQVKDMQWMQQHVGNFVVTLEDFTEDWGGLLLTGPKARDILQSICEDDLSNSAFPWLACRTIQLDSAPVFAMRVSYAGELGWELHMPVWQVISIYESLMKNGVEHGLRNFGTRAFNSMRIEKMYRAYGGEFTEEVSAVEAGMDRFLDLSRDFIGSDNLRQRQTQPLALQLAYLSFDDDIPAECFGNEAVFADGEHTGIITAGAYGYRVGRSLAFAYLKPEHCVEGQKLTVETSIGTRHCHVELDAAYDATNTLLRS
jgi:dimethylglycine dehydrogenase